MHSDTFRLPIWEFLMKNDTFRSTIWEVCKNWYVQISDLNTPGHVAMMACVCGGTSAYRDRCSYCCRHMPSWQLAYWWPQSLQHIVGYMQLAKFADSDHLTPIHNYNVTPLIFVSTYHHVTPSNTLTTTLNLSPTLTINPNTNHSPNPSKIIIIISPTALRIAPVSYTHLTLPTNREV